MSAFSNFKSWRILPLSTWLGAAIVVALTINFEATALAHISVDQGGTHLSRYSDSGLKESPCGVAGGTRGTNIYTYKPGETITVSIKEVVSHPSYFRIAFDNDGDDGFLTPSGTAGEFGNCAGDPACGPGHEDYCNNDTVLLDHLNPHAGAFGTTPIYTWSVTLPNVECDNCTLQIIQVMNDLNVHTAPYPQDDVYYQCIDLVLSNSAPDVNDAPLVNDGMVCPGGSNSNPGDAGTAGTMATGGAISIPGTGGTSGDGTNPTGTSSPDSGVTVTGGNSPINSTGGVPDPGTTGGVIGDPTTGPVTSSSPTTSSGCGCNTLGVHTQSSDNLGLLGLGLAAFVMRRRKSAAQKQRS